MKIYAKQVPPEYQESPLFLGDDFWPENVHVYGNRDYKEHGNYNDTSRALDQLGQDIDDMRGGCGWNAGGNLESLLQYYFPRENPYVRAERLRVLDIVATFWEYRAGSYEERAAVLEIMEMRDGIKYEAGTIHGCCQGDWQEIIYPAEYGRDWLEHFEMEYFNTGSEWIIDPDGEHVSVYAYSWNNDGIRAEIAAAASVDPADVILLAFNGWKRTPEYAEV